MIKGTDISLEILK